MPNRSARATCCFTSNLTDAPPLNPFFFSKLRRVIGVSVIAFLVLSSCPQLVHSWGYEAHRMISKRAVKSLPTAIQPFYDDHWDSLERLSVYPDRRRYFNDVEGPRHYVDLERLPGDTIPETYQQAVNHYGWETLNRAGYVPWRAQKVYEQLVDALRNERYVRVLFKSGTLSHYVADAHVPLHTTENYDGQLTGDTGVHSRFESDLIEQFPDVIEERYDPAQQVEDVPARLIETVHTSHGFVQEVLAGDRQNQYSNREKDGYSLVKARETHGELASRRLNDAAHTTASLWYSAWVEAGRPELPDAYFGDYLEKPTEQSRSLTFYQGTWSGDRSWMSRRERRQFRRVKTILDHRYGVRLAIVEISKPPGEFARVNVDVMSGDGVDVELLENDLRQALHPLDVYVDRSE